MHTDTPNRRWARPAALAVAATLLFAACGDDDDPATTADGDAANGPSEGATESTVVIEDFTFVDAALTVPVGATITFENRDDAPHTATARGGAFDTDSVAGGDSATVTLDEAGDFSFYCSFHPFMEGTVTVE